MVLSTILNTCSQDNMAVEKHNSFPLFYSLSYGKMEIAVRSHSAIIMVARCLELLPASPFFSEVFTPSFLGAINSVCVQTVRRINEGPLGLEKEYESYEKNSLESSLDQLMRACLTDRMISSLSPCLFSTEAHAPIAKESLIMTSDPRFVGSDSQGVVDQKKGICDPLADMAGVFQNIASHGFGIMGDRLRSGG
ncbi:hypothetical protein L1887_38776 [Cichorium endivia]|nr:hypothetical protein L1887_38776 [Cichorium endivia]